MEQQSFCCLTSSASKTTLTCTQPWISFLPRSPLTESPVLRKAVVFQLHHSGPRPGPRLHRLFIFVQFLLDVIMGKCPRASSNIMMTCCVATVTASVELPSQPLVNVTYHVCLHSLIMVKSSSLVSRRTCCCWAGEPGTK
ncbi:unnamed protein product [Pleuronectes platessa]|uniref:Uncharacterized protein n=1 Tax=Pleuronectes platessa TaxID=8262 RepID=A0A9N7TQE7_PLEPL|nr:unnamed protein product [Pleuronectes platessa]